MCVCSEGKKESVCAREFIRACVFVGICVCVCERERNRKPTHTHTHTHAFLSIHPSKMDFIASFNICDVCVYTHTHMYMHPAVFHRYLSIYPCIHMYTNDVHVRMCVYTHTCTCTQPYPIYICPSIPMYSYLYKYPAICIWMTYINQTYTSFYLQGGQDS